MDITTASFSDVKLFVEKIPLAQDPDTPKSSNAHYSSVARVGGFLYVIGRLCSDPRAGFPHNQPVIGVLDIRRKKWLAIRHEGFMVHVPRMFLYEDGLYVYAQIDWKNDRSGKVSRFDLIEEEWSYCKTTGTGVEKEITGRAYCSGDYLEKRDCFVVFGGGSTTLKSQLKVLLMPECRWTIPTVKGRPPARRHSHGSCVVQDVVYYYGGWSRSQRQMDGIFILAFSGRDVATWSVVQNTLNSHVPLSSFTMLPWKGKILMCGGRTLNSNNHGFSMYDPNTGSFEEAREETAEAQIGRAIGVGLQAFTIDQGSSFGLICGHKDITNYHCLSTLT